MITVIPTIYLLPSGYFLVKIPWCPTKFQASYKPGFCVICLYHPQRFRTYPVGGTLKSSGPGLQTKMLAGSGGTGRRDTSYRNWESILILKHSQFPGGSCACQINCQNLGCIFFFKIRKKKNSIILMLINNAARLDLVLSDPWRVIHLHFLPLSSSFPALQVSDLPTVDT